MEFSSCSAFLFCFPLSPLLPCSLVLWQSRVLVPLLVGSPDLFHIVLRYANRASAEVLGRVLVLEGDWSYDCANCECCQTGSVVPGSCGDWWLVLVGVASAKPPAPSTAAPLPPHPPLKGSGSHISSGVNLSVCSSFSPPAAPPVAPSCHLRSVTVAHLCTTDLFHAPPVFLSPFFTLSSFPCTFFSLGPPPFSFLCSPCHPSCWLPTSPSCSSCAPLCSCSRLQ